MRKIITKTVFFLLIVLLTGNVSALGYQCDGNNILSSVPFELRGTYFAPGWNWSDDFSETWADGKLTLHLGADTWEVWQAQFPLRSDIQELVEGTTYFLSFDIETSADLPRVYMKVQKDGDDGHYLELPPLSISAGARTISGIFENTGGTVISQFDKIIFDFGGNPANVDIVISNIIICDGYSGEPEPSVTYFCDGNDIVSGVSLTSESPYYAPGWTSTDNYTKTWVNGKLTLHLGAATWEAWQAQFPLRSADPQELVEGTTYFLSFDIETSKDLPRVYMKVQKYQGEDSHYLDLPPLMIPAGTRTISGIFENTGGTTITQFDEILFDFGGNPEDVDIVISNLIICDGYSGEPPASACDGKDILSEILLEWTNPYFAPYWTPSPNYEGAWANDKLTLHLGDATVGDWQAQFFLKSANLQPLVAGTTYFLSFDIENSKDLPRVYMKVQRDGEAYNNYYIDIPSLNVPAGVHTISGNFENTGGTTITQFDMVLFDFGGNPNDVDIVISNIIICDGDSGSQSYVSTIPAKAVSVFSANGQLYISGSKEVVTVYNAFGKVVYKHVSAENLSVELAKGLYIVKVGATTSKLLVQ